MAIITISTPKVIPSTANNTPAVTLNSGDTLNLLANAGIFDYATGGGSHASRPRAPIPSCSTAT